MEPSLNLSDFGFLLEGKLVHVEEVWYLVDANGVHHSMEEIFLKYENQDVRFTMSDMETLAKLQDQLSKVLPGVSGLNKADIIKRLKNS